ncbi:MAG: DUF5693 family protein [Bacillota bacterium]
MKKALFIVLLAILVINIPFMLDRIDMEEDNKNYELILDMGELIDLQRTGEDLSLEMLQNAGLTGAALPADSLDDLQEQGQISIWRQGDLPGLSDNLFQFLNETKLLPPEKGAVIYMSPAISRRFSSAVQTGWENTYEVEVEDWQGGKLVLFPRWHEDLEDLVPGYDSAVFAEIEELELFSVIRLSDQPEQILNQILLAEGAAQGVQTVIFSGDEVAGYPDNIDDTAAILSELGLKYGMIEPFIADQDGANDLASEQLDNIVRVHSIQQDEMAKYSGERIINRYVRSARDRNVRYLYLRGIPITRPGENLGHLQIDLIEGITEGLKEANFQSGSVVPLTSPSVQNWQIIAIAVATILLGILFVNKFLGDHVPTGLYSSLLFTGVILFSAAYYVLDQILIRQILALALAVLVPSLSSFFIVDIFSKNSIVSLLKAVSLSLFGGLLLATILSSPEFYTQVEVFRGVKIAFIAPLFLTVIYYLFKERKMKSFNDMKRYLDQSLNLVLKFKHILLAGAAFVVLIVYVGRTGNLPLVPVPPWELIIRDYLEQILIIRPRFKEFLFGHPFLLLLPLVKLYYSIPLLKFVMVIMATIGQITVINSFSHLHTPLLTSVIRTAHGYWLAVPVAIVYGLILIGLYKVYDDWQNTDFSSEA